jgi:hypothetical protein
MSADKIKKPVYPHKTGTRQFFKKVKNVLWHTNERERERERERESKNRAKISYFGEIF